MNIKKLVNHLKYENIFKLYKNDGKINWKAVSNHNELPYEFIDKYFHQLKPFNIEQKQKLNSYLLKKYKSYINWFTLAAYQEIPDDVLNLYFKLFDKRIQLSIIKYQNLKFNFLLENIDLFKEKNFLNALMQNLYINASIKEKIKSLL